jgi:hypothetical protein
MHAARPDRRQGRPVPKARSRLGLISIGSRALSVVPSPPTIWPYYIVYTVPLLHTTLYAGWGGGLNKFPDPHSTERLPRAFHDSIVQLGRVCQSATAKRRITMCRSVHPDPGSKCALFKEFCQHGLAGLDWAGLAPGH